MHIRREWEREKEREMGKERARGREGGRKGGREGARGERHISMAYRDRCRWPTGTDIDGLERQISMA